jgi:hypothetical protein
MTVTASDTNPGAAIPVAEPEVRFVLPDTAEGLVKKWVAEDADYDLSERRSVEEMEEGLAMAADFFLTSLGIKEIVAKYAPNAPHRVECITPKSASKAPYPAELEPLVQSGVAFILENRWCMVKRCMTCGTFDGSCGHNNSYQTPAVDSGTHELTDDGRQALGLDPIRVPIRKPTAERIPTPPLSADQIMWSRSLQNHWSPGLDWRNSFKSAGELEGSGSVKMYVENFIPEGITLICGLPKEGKSFLAMSVAKALTTGQPLFGKVGYEVPEPVPVLYLAAESGDGGLKLRCDKMKITKDKKMFVARTLSQGLMPTLDSPLIEEVIKDLRPVVILETLIRFNDGTDEDSSTENRKLAEALFRLIALGARAIIGIHHSRKDLDKKRPTKEAAVRGSGDGLAMVDAVWLVMQDSQLHQNDKGPNQVDIVGWGRDFSPTPIRLALTRKKTDEDQFEFAPGIVSCIDGTGDFVWVQKSVKLDSDAAVAKADQIDKDVERLVTGNPTISRRELTEQTGYTEKRVKNALKRLGYSRKSGDATATSWVQSVGPFVGPSN